MGKIQPFKALGSVVKTAAPFASMIPGVSPLAAFGLNAGSSLLFGGGSGGSKGSSKSGYGTAAQMALLGPILQLLNNPGAAVSDFRNQASADANRLAMSRGGLLAEETQNPNALAATRLALQNDATSAGNQFQYDVMSPAGRAQAAQGALGLLQGVNQQHLNQYQINKEFQQPTVLESLVNAGTAALPWYLENQKKKQPTQATQATQPLNYGGLNVGGGLNYGVQPWMTGGLGWR